MDLIRSSKIRVTALAILVGALPLLFPAGAYASEQTSTENRWLDDYNKPVGFTYGAEARIQASYLYRGNYSGGPNIQAEANVGYGGLYALMWWNIGVKTVAFDSFLPEVDFIFGFKRWGLDISVLYVHNFNCNFFDITNYPYHGNSLELRGRWTVSSKLPLSILWATRLAGSDGYINNVGDTIRAWSSYLEISYTHHFPYGISLYGAFGITPWKSRYTRFQRDFAFQLIEVKLRKDWSVSKHCGLMVMGAVTINPSGIAADPSSIQWKPYMPGNQTINANLGFGVYLK